MLVSGIHEEGVSPIQILTIEGIDFAILNYTYGPNMEIIPNSIEPHLDMLCNYNEANQLDFTTLNPQVLKDIEEAEQMADIVIVCPHWGTEYTTKPSSYQKKFALQMVEAGADIIIGTHPHVVQPVEWVESDNGNRALCYYSLGNYVSSQKQALCMLEAMAWITFEVTENGAVLKEEETGVVPLVCHYSAMPVRFERVYLLEEYTEELAAIHGIKAYGGVNLVLSDLQNWTQDVFGENVLSAEQTAGIKVEPKEVERAETSEHSEYYIPGVSVEDVVRYFNEVSLDAEFVNSGDPTKLQRWETPIKYICTGEATNEDKEVMESLMEWLNTVEGFPGIYEAESETDANLHIYFCEEKEYLSKMGDNYQGTDGGVTFWYNGANQIYDGIIGYRTDIAQEIRNSVILEEIYNGLGPVNDTQLREDSLIYSGYSTPQSLTDIDELIIKLLYHPQMQCGMDAAACEEVIRKIYY